MSRNLRWRRGSKMACCGVKVTNTRVLGTGISPFEWGHHYSYHSLAWGQATGKGNCLAHQQKIGLKIYWAWTHQSKTQIPPQPVPSIRKLPQTSYSLPSEGGQNENHNLGRGEGGSQDGRGIGQGPLSPRQIHQKIIGMLSNFHKTTS